MTMSEIPLQDLPLWMRRARRGVDWGVLISIAISLLAALPFLLQPGLPRTNASENYVFRANDYAQALSEGHLYPRWSPNVFGGYGAPVPSFYPPAPAYIPALIQFFFTGDPVSAVQVVYCASIVLAGSAMYAFVMRRAGAAAGVLASALYVFSPYVSLVAPHILGDLPSAMSMALLPSLLWGIDRLLVNHNSLDFLVTTLCCAALLLTEPRHALAGLLIGAAFLAWYRLIRGGDQRWRWVVVAGLLGVSVSAFYWLPALVEQSAVTWRAVGDKVQHTLSLGTLLAPLRPVDPDELVHTPQFTLGLALVLFTAATIVMWMRRRQATSFHLLFLGAAAILFIAAAIVPGEMWLLGSIVLCLSIAATALLQPREQPHRLLFPLLFAAVLALSIPGWFVPRWSESFGPVDAPAQVQYEQLGYGVAVLPPGSAVPSTIPITLQPDQTLVNSYSSDTVRKIDISPGMQIGVLAHTSQSDQFQIEARAPGNLRMLTAYFPGWMASLNNTSLAVQPDSAGLLSIEIPTNASGTLTVALGTTPTRTIAWALSVGALAVTLLAAFRRFNRQEDTFVELNLLSTPQTRLAAIVLAAVAGLMLLFTTQISPFRLTARPGYELDGSTGLHARTEVGLEALSFRLSAPSFRMGDRIPLTIYWRALRFLPANYRAQILLLNLTTGERLTVTDLRHLGGYPTQRWLTNRYVSDRYTLSLPDAAAPGEYALAVEVFDCTDACTPQDRLTFFDQSGAPLGQTLVLPQRVMLQE